MNDPASLDNLRDIVEPTPVPWWPPAPGWWVVFAIVMILAGWFAARAWLTWRRNAYRRAALRELRAATRVSQIAEILKRTALCACRRTDIAALSGPEWYEWLGRTVGKQVPSEVAEALTRGVYADAEAADVAEVRAFATDWVQGHPSRLDSRLSLRDRTYSRGAETDTGVVTE